MGLCYCGSNVKNLNAHYKTKKHQNFPTPPTFIPSSFCLRSSLNKISFKDDAILVFFETNKKECNDAINKIRESILEELVNNPLLLDKFSHSEHYDLWKMVATNFRSALVENCPSNISFDYINVKKMAGRGHNYDFVIRFYDNNKLVYSFNCEIKSGDSIWSYPQMVSIHIKNNSFSMFLPDSESYIEFWYDNYLSDFISELDVIKPSFKEYLHSINSTTYKTPLHSIIYATYKGTDERQIRRLNRIVNESIRAYLIKWSSADVNMNHVRKVFSNQMKKTFIFAKNGKFTSEKIQLEDEPIISFSHNSVIFTMNSIVVSALLRWKNYKGCAGPAWQIGIRKLKI